MSIREQVPRLSISSRDEQPLTWFPRPKEKCKGEYYTEKVKLLVNWFRFEKEIRGKTIFEYEIEIKKMLTDKRGKPMEKDVQKNEIPTLFWAFLRNVPSIRIDSIVFDDHNTAYTSQDYGRKIEERMESNGKRFKMTWRFVKQFQLNFSREHQNNEEIANTSSKFLKCLFSQKCRYSADTRDTKSIEYVKKFTTYKNSIYRVPQSGDPIVTITAGIEAWMGVYIGIRETIKDEPVLNFGLVDGLFTNMPEVDLLQYFLMIAIPGCEREEELKKAMETIKRNEFGMREDQKKKAKRLLLDLKLKSTTVWDTKFSRMVEKHLTFVDFDSLTADNYQVPDKRGNGHVLSQIYENHGIKLNFKHLPLVKCKSGKFEGLVPFELLKVHEKPQKFVNNLDINMKLAFLRATTRKPQDHLNKTQEIMRMLELESKDLNFINAFGLSPKLQMIECPGKVLNEPNLVNKENKKISMTETIRGFQEKCLNVVSQKTLCCALFALRGDRKETPCATMQELHSFYKNLMDTCLERGINVGEEDKETGARSLLWLYDNVSCFEGADCFHIAAQHAKDKFENLVDNEKKELFFIIISERAFDAYGHVKWVCDNQLGIANQFIDCSTLRKAVIDATDNVKPSRKIFFNIALKINAKLDGVNQELGFSEEAEMTVEEKEELNKKPLIMYVGIDVTHPTQNSGINFSIASIVASINRGGTRYRNEIVAQMEKQATKELSKQSGKEKTDILENKFVSLLQIFAERNGNRLPNRIVVFRDGVSDSEMLRTAHDELTTLRKEVAEFINRRSSNENEPLYTYIVIQKRHKTKFYKKCEGNKIENPTSGTVCDKEVVSSYKFDFWLASHHGALGTTRPGHYTVLYDNSGMTMDACYEMCYGMSFLSSRCRKPISLPAPVHYAHLSCEKAKEIYKAMDQGRAPSSKNRFEIEKHLKPSSGYPGMAFV